MATRLDPDYPGDEANPYAPPQSQFEPFSPSRSPTIVPFDLGCILSATWTLYKERLVVCIAVCWTMLGLIWGMQFGQRRLLRGLAAAPGDWSGHFLVQFAVLFVGYVFNVWLGVGQNLAMLAVARRQPAVLERVFQGSRYVLTSILAAILFMLAIGLIVMVNLVWMPILSGLVGSPGSAMFAVFAVGIAIAFLVGVHVSARFSQFSYMIVDHNAGALDSLGWSWEATRGRVGTLVVVYAMLGLINLGGLLACFVGLLFTVPFTGLMLAVTYLSLTGQPVGGGKPAPASWDEISFQDD